MTFHTYATHNTKSGSLRLIAHVKLKNQLNLNLHLNPEFRLYQSNIRVNRPIPKTKKR